MDYILINVNCDPPFRDILIAEMGELGFDSFVNTEPGFEAYIPDDTFSHPALQTLFNNYRNQTRIWYELKKIPKVNWNEEWEKNYDPIEVNDQIYVRATFHESKPGFQHEIVINPQMSFGTGHHETTHQILALQMDVDFKDKTVLDVGSGTGILAIMALKLGAKNTAATDIDDWCIENTLENFKLNNFEAEFVEKGTIEELNLEQRYEIILANINTNVLLNEIPTYVGLLEPKGKLFLSGFYEKDKPQITDLTDGLGLREIKSTIKRGWVAMVLVKL